MKLLFLLFSILPLASSLDLKSQMAKFDELFKQYPQNPTLVDDMFAQDAVICMEDECSPYKQVLEDWFRGVKTFDYLNDIRHAGKRVMSGRCWDFMDYHDSDCHTMFYVDWVSYFDDEGKIEKHITMMTQEQTSQAFKCVTDNIEVGASGETK